MEKAEINHSKMIVALQYNINELEQKLPNITLSSLHPQRIAEFEKAGIGHNKTIVSQQQQINQLDKAIIKYDRTCTIQRQRIAELENTEMNRKNIRGSAKKGWMNYRKTNWNLIKQMRVNGRNGWNWYKSNTPLAFNRDGSENEREFWCFSCDS